MNNKRRKELKKLILQLEECVLFLQSLIDEEQDTYDNIPESLQYGNKACIIEDTICSMQEACDKISEAIDDIKEL